jgi:NodT family efflux transporter outer membrane factor (OMF) lipoprotein
VKPARLLPCLLTSALSACAVGPDYQPPAIATPPAWSAPTGAAAPAGTAAAASEARAGDSGAWWLQFRDPELDSLIDRAVAGNLDLQAAVSRIRAAREQLILAGAARLPSLNADADVDNTHLSQNSGISEFAQLLGGGSSAPGAQKGGTAFAPPGNSFTSYTLGFDASWELDLFGGVRRSIEAAQARAEQALWTARDSAVSVSAEVARDYFTLRALQRQIAITRDEIAAQRHMLALIEARRSVGFVTALDVHQQSAQLASTEATLPDLDAQMRAQAHALAVLAGAAPEALDAELAEPRAPPEPAVQVPAGLPSQLLRRRPDIRAAERALAASNADIGVAVADLFPKLSLSGTLDLVSLDLAHLLEASSRQSSIAAALSWPILAGGQVRANIRLRKEQNLQALYGYRKAVLTALQDVEDSLTRYADERRRNQALRRALADAHSAREIAGGQYQAGLIDFTSVLSAQEAELRTRAQLTQSDADLCGDLASIYKALGGGWERSSAALR